MIDLMRLALVLAAIFLIIVATQNRALWQQNDGLRRQRRKAAVRIVRLRRALGDAEDVCVELGRECDAYRAEEAKRERRREGVALN